MRLSVTPPDLDAAWRGTEEAIADNLTKAMRDGGADLQADLRAQTEAAFQGNRMPKTWRIKHYPRAEASLSPSAYVYSRAGKIIEAFDQGVTIRSKDGFWLAIPTAEAGRFGSRRGAAPFLSRGGHREKITPGGWERRTGMRLRFVYTGEGRALLVADQAQLRRGLAAPYSSRGRGSRLYGPAGQTIVVFILVRQVRLNKRLDIPAAAQRAADRMPGLIARHWR